MLTDNDQLGNPWNRELLYGYQTQMKQKEIEAIVDNIYEKWTSKIKQ